jgi:hypothetical protein
MDPSAIMVLVFFALVLVASNGLKLAAPRAAGFITVSSGVRGWLAVGVVMLLAGGGAVSVLHPTAEQIGTAAGIFAVLLSGVIAKWVWDATLHTPFQLDGPPLMGALVVTPLVALASWNLLSGAPDIHSLLLCFSNGFFWQTIFSDISKRREAASKNSEISALEAKVAALQSPKPN